MEERAGEAGREDFCISMEEFDIPESRHTFSGAYRRKKKRMLRAYRRRVCQPVRYGWRKAAAVVLLVLAVPGIARAASESGFFWRVWGTHNRETIESHEEVLYDAEKGTSCIVVYPRREYTDKGLEKAEELLGDAVSCNPLVRELGDIRLTVVTAVYDGSVAVVEFTLEGVQEVREVICGQLYNESKGAWFTEDAPFRFSFTDCSEMIYVDPDQSTDEILYCCAYLVTGLPEDAKELTMEIYRRQEGGADAEIWTDPLVIPVYGKPERREYVNAEGGTVSISPMSVDVDCNIGLGLTAEQRYDPWYIYYVAVRDKDGDVYIVHEHEIKGIHHCETDIDNTGYTCGTTDNHLVFAFNRLVDMETVESIVVNETMYVLK